MPHSLAGRSLGLQERLGALGLSEPSPPDSGILPMGLCTTCLQFVFIFGHICTRCLKNSNPHKTRAIFSRYSKAVIVNAFLSQSEHKLILQHAAKYNHTTLPAFDSQPLTLATLSFLNVTKYDVFLSKGRATASVSMVGGIRLLISLTLA